MTDKELRKLKRAELMELLFYQQQEAETLRQENQELKERINRLEAREADPVLPEDFYEQIETAVQKAMNDYLKNKTDAVKTAWKDLPDRVRKKVIPQQNRKQLPVTNSEGADSVE